MSEVAEDPAQLILDLAASTGATAEQWASLEWRLDNLYWIVDKQAKTCRFVLNDQQRQFIRNLWYRNLILKARQLGFSTLMQILQLDQALCNVNFTGVVIADTLPNAGKLFKKVEFAYDHLPALMKQAFPLASKTTGSEIRFAHPDGDGIWQPSGISVSVSSRGGTVNLLHVSELGKIALKFPQRAAEIVTGAIPSVPQDGCAVVESTAEGAFGEFYDLCEPAIKRMEAGKPETVLDWRLHFFPWFECKDYRLSDEDADLVDIPETLRSYFAKIQAELRIVLDRHQRAWYAKTAETLKKKMKQEYPSTPKEAFEQAIEGAVYGDQMTWLREHGRLTVVPLDPNYPVNTYWDFGVGVDRTGGGDTHSIWFEQQVGLQHRWFYYVSGHGKGLRHWWLDVCEAHHKRHGYQWGKHFLPHDANAEMLGEVVTTKRRILEGLGMENIVVVPRVPALLTGLEITRSALAGNHWFYDHMPNPELGDDLGAKAGIKCLDGYQFEWDDKLGTWTQRPLHNWASHGADAWRQFAQAEANGLTEVSTLLRSEEEDDDYGRSRRSGRRDRHWKTS